MFLDKLQHINAFILDVDGVLTNGLLHVTESGEHLRQFNIKDGYALQLAVKRGFYVAAISGGISKGVELRLKGLGIQDIFLGVQFKIKVYQQLLEKNNLSPKQILYMGDDIPDLPIMKVVGLPVCPADAAEEVKAIAQYVSPKNGGNACVRDVIEKVLKVQNKWYDEEKSEDFTLNSF